MNILITGGCGYIGYSLVKKIITNNSSDSIFLYDNLSSRNMNFFIGDELPNQERLTLILGDILDNFSLKNTLQENNIEVVIHLAAKASTPFADHDAHSFDQVNNWGTACLVDAIESTPSVKKVIYLSSISVYGHSQGEIVTEQTIPGPKTFYGISKLRGEKHIQRLSKNHDTYVIRAGNVFGYNPCIRIQSVFNKLVFEAHFKKRIELHGSGLQNRAFVHVLSLANVLSELALGNATFPRLFNKYDCNLSILNIVEHILDVYPETERIFIDQHLEMRNVKAGSKNIANPIITKEQLINYIQEISNNFTFSSKKTSYEESLGK